MIDKGGSDNSQTFVDFFLKIKYFTYVHVLKPSADNRNISIRNSAKKEIVLIWYVKIIKEYCRFQYSNIDSSISVHFYSRRC